MLSDKGSNLDRQNQNLQCYHYTIGQSGCKDTAFFKNANNNVKILKISKTDSSKSLIFAALIFEDSS